MQENCDIAESDNLVIYGHHIKGGKMFGALEDYKSKSFYEEHKTIQFDTLTEQAEYEIVAIFKTVAYSSEGFRYYDFVDAENEEEFNSYVDSMSHLRRLEDAQPISDKSNISGYVTAIADSARILCEQSGKTLSIQNNISDIPIGIDYTFVSQVNNNLISNAIRYATSKVNITYTSNNDGFYLSVSDNGCGFSKNILSKATNPYFTEEENHSEHFGLGLYICKILCEHHGGYLKIENCSIGAKVTAFFKSLD